MVDMVEKCKQLMGAVFEIQIFSKHPNSRPYQNYVSPQGIIDMEPSLGKQVTYTKPLLLGSL